MPRAADEDEDEVLMNQVRSGLAEVQSRMHKLFLLRLAEFAAIIAFLATVLLWRANPFAPHTVPYESAEYDSGRRTVIIWLRDMPTIGLPRVHRTYELANISSVSLEGVTFSLDGREAYIRLKAPFSHRQSDDQTAFAIRSRRR